MESKAARQSCTLMACALRLVRKGNGANCLPMGRTLFFSSALLLSLSLSDQSSDEIHTSTAPKHILRVVRRANPRTTYSEFFQVAMHRIACWGGV
jgi:hypothetical protein